MPLRIPRLLSRRCRARRRDAARILARPTVHLYAVPRPILPDSCKEQCPDLAGVHERPNRADGGRLWHELALRHPRCPPVHTSHFIARALPASGLVMLRDGDRGPVDCSREEASPVPCGVSPCTSHEPNPSCRRLSGVANPITELVGEILVRVQIGGRGGV